MPTDNKVVWSEGMFLSPQHFQQQERYIESFIERRCRASGAYSWGFQDIQVDSQLLQLGKISILSAQGVMPDGTPFNVPDSDEPPPVLEVPENTHSCVLYLGLPVRRPGALETSTTSGTSQGLARYRANEQDCYDSSSDTGDSESIQLGKMRLRLLLETDDLSGFAYIGFARIVETRDDKKVLLDDDYIPTCFDCNASRKISGFLTEFVGLLHQRGEAIAGRLVDARRAGTAQVADYMMLQVINRLEPLVTHFSQQDGLHPQVLYADMLQMLGELSTFTAATKRPPQLANYIHEQLEISFHPVIAGLRQALSVVFEQTAISLPLAMRKYGIRVAVITDHSIIDSAQFVLSVKADVQGDTIRTRFPAQVTIGPVESIRQLVNISMPGIKLNALSVAPRQIPYHSGFTYFELDHNSKLWKELHKSGGFAIHVSGEFPGLEIEFWAVRE